MLLTIGMIVKNEEKYLEQCLNGIKPILEQVDSELIIADTGSTDRTVEIAKKFTDNVFYFEWIKDFSAARNSTLEKAQGEWFMFVDGDEVFESCDGIIKFFNSGEYKKYNSASYIVRSFVNGKEEKDKNVRYSDFRAPRLTKKLKETKFVNPVHETLTTYGRPIKLIDDIAIHYGYCAGVDTDEAKKKFKRNEELLLKRFNGGERSALLYIQLYECYARHEPEKADEYLDEGIEACEKKKDWVVPALFSRKAASLYGDKKYDELLELCGRYFNLDKKIRNGVIITDVDIACAQALSLTQLERYDEAVSKYLRFFSLFYDMKKGKLTSDQSILSSRDFARDDNFIAVLVMFVKSCIETGKHNVAFEQLKKHPLVKYPVIPGQIQDLVYLETDILDKIGYENAHLLYKQHGAEGKKFLSKMLFEQMFRTNNSHVILNFFETEEDCKEFYEPARMAALISESRKNRDYKTCISEMKNLIVKYPSLAPFISEYQKEVLKEYEESQPKTEMEKLSVMIKINIRNYIARGNIDAAKKTLAEYEKINPSDPEIGALKAKIQ